MGQDKPAQVFGAYRIERSFGAGFGVFLARPTATPEASFIVLKRRPSLGLKVDRVPFLTIPEVAEVRDAGRVSDCLYVAMERIPGRDLFSVWNRCAEKRISVPPEVAVAIMMGVLAGLRNAHREGVAHGNIWPGKVMLTPMGRVILTEFMLSRSLIGALAVTNPRLTSFRAGYGPLPASNTPEAEDILLAGRMLWELLAGRPIASGSHAQVNESTSSGFAVDRPSRNNPEVPPSLDEIALRALSTDPRAAFASAQDFQSALGGAAGLASSRELIATFLRRLYEESELTGVPATTPGSLSDVQVSPIVGIVGGTKVFAEPRRADPVPIRAAQQRRSKPVAPSFGPSTEPARSRSVGRTAMVAGAIAMLGAVGALAYVWQTRRGPEPPALAEGEQVEPARSLKTPEPPPTVSQPKLKVDPVGNPGPDPRRGDPPQVPKAVEPPPPAEQPPGLSQHRIARDAPERPDRHAHSQAQASGSSFTDQGQAAFDHGDFNAALALARHAVRAHEGAAAYILMGDAEIKRGDKKAAGQAYRAALRLDPRSEVAKIGLEAASKPR